MVVAASVINFIPLGWAVLVKIEFQYILETKSVAILDHHSTFYLEVNFSSAKIISVNKG